MISVCWLLETDRDRQTDRQRVYPLVAFTLDRKIEKKEGERERERDIGHERGNERWRETDYNDGGKIRKKMRLVWHF